MKSKLNLTILGLLLTSTTVRGQVTIGSDVAPAQGALLQIMSQKPDIDNITSTYGGLLLPRVALDNNTSLTPLIADTVGQNKIHTGLVVYNIVPQLTIGKGAFVWSGTEWLKITDYSNTVQSLHVKNLLQDTRNYEVRGYGLGGSIFGNSTSFQDASKGINYSLKIPRGALLMNKGYVHFNVHATRSAGLGAWHIGFKSAINGTWQNSFLSIWNVSSGSFYKSGRIFFNDGKLFIETEDKEYIFSEYNYDPKTDEIAIVITGGTTDPLTLETIDYASFTLYE